MNGRSERRMEVFTKGIVQTIGKLFKLVQSKQSLSLVVELTQKKYENTRRQYVIDRRNNKDHKLWRFGWNGVSPGMWFEREWYDYLSQQEDGLRYLKMYHPESVKVDLEEFFG